MINTLSNRLCEFKSIELYHIASKRIDIHTCIIIEIYGSIYTMLVILSYFRIPHQGIIFMLKLLINLKVDYEIMLRSTLWITMRTRMHTNMSK